MDATNPSWVEIRILAEIRKIVTSYSEEIDYLNRNPDPVERRNLKCSENGKTVEKILELFKKYRRIFMFNKEIPWKGEQ